MNSIPIAGVNFEVVPVLEEKGMQKLLADIAKVINKTTITGVVKQINDSSMPATFTADYEVLLNKQEDLTKLEAKNLKEEKKNNSIFHSSVQSLLTTAILLRSAMQTGSGVLNVVMGELNKTLETIGTAGAQTKDIKDFSSELLVSDKHAAMLRDIFMRGANINEEQAKAAINAVASQFETFALEGYQDPTNLISMGAFGRGFLDLDIFDKVESILQASTKMKNQRGRDKFLQSAFGASWREVSNILNAKEGTGDLGAIFKTLENQFNYESLYTGLKAENDRSTDLLIEKLNSEVAFDTLALEVKITDLNKELRKLNLAKTTGSAAIEVKVRTDNMASAMQEGVLTGFDKLVAGDSKGFFAAMKKATTDGIMEGLGKGSFGNTNNNNKKQLTYNPDSHMVHKGKVYFIDHRNSGPQRGKLDKAETAEYEAANKAGAN